MPKVFVLAIDDVDASVKTAELVRQHFPHLKIFARARNRQHSFRLMDLGVLASSARPWSPAWKKSVQVLESLGLSSPRPWKPYRFRVPMKRSWPSSLAVKDDEKKFLQTSGE